ncbi:type II toxin-antitoxin system PemK/MazF family toxin [Microcoleus sp. CAWBG640]|uniref:type II toxin-antitoxin system PemK/MazF family toxin n=1 Tax=Microcoleus sp. CAWBG640 TaxID=2841653 RepID=UPI00312B349C
MKPVEIYYANLSPAVGSEMDKRRPILIVSNDANNRAANIAFILGLRVIYLRQKRAIALS